MKLLSGIKECDRYPLNFLKGKFYKNLPGAVFSLLMMLLKLSVMILCIVYYIFQKTKVSLTFEPISTFDNNIVFPEEQITINISITQLNKENSKGIETAMEYYRMTAIRVQRGQIIMNIFPNEFKNNTLNYSIPYSKIKFSDNQSNVNFPRVSYLSCKFIRNLLNFDSLITIEESDIKYLEGCKDISDDFYQNENILNKLFIYSFQMTESSLTAGYEIKTTNRYIPFGFYFRKNDHPVYESAQRKMAVLFDNKLFISNSEYIFFMNWLFPTKTQLKAFSSDFDIQQIFSVKNQNQIMVYKVYKVSLLNDILPWFGSFNRLMSCMDAIPAIWTSYYLTILVYQLYKSKFPNDITSIDLEKFSYWKWLGLRFGCTTKAKEMNKEMIRMRKELSNHFERLYRRRTEVGEKGEIEFDDITGIKVNVELEGKDKE